ncbi:ATP-binding cassette domain-containing protein [Cryobacterium sp. PAMC25264]|uniref:ATP-binding cassette domain-containing protein n=1 Tax=Cryobacterium sp. PAMC25264 TaxID=2861288 RepID=UPI001C62DF20|nr:ATP-binding cassette domain-containing protein [Cryobacterium sp. PAMC25264]QYF73588.1 ABC transporter permease subunit [Cryobacterium sp. PAMC25264]
MRAVAGPRWLGFLIPASLLISAVLLVARLAGPADALLSILSARLPLSTAAAAAAPVLSATLGVGLGLLAAQRSPWAARSLRALAVIGSALCAAWVALAGAFWFAVQAEVMPVFTDEPLARAGLGVLSTLVLPGTAVVFGAAVAVAVHVHEATRRVAREPFVQTARSRGLPISRLVVRTALRRALAAILSVLVAEVVLVYGCALLLQAVLTRPALSAQLPPLLAPESLPAVLGAALFVTVAIVIGGVMIATVAPGAPTLEPHSPAPRHRAGASGSLAVILSDTSSPSTGPTRASTTFRASDVLDIRDLRLRPHGAGSEHASGAGISLTVSRGQALAVIGDEGSGAMALCLAIAGLLPPATVITSGSVLFEGTELVGLPEQHFRKLRGRRIGFFDRPAPDRFAHDWRIARQLSSVIAPADTRRTRRSTLDLLQRVGVETPEAVLDARPRDLSAVTLQRVLLACALARNPHLLIALDPAAGFDPHDEAGLLDLLHDLQRERELTLIVASARPIVVTRCDRVAVLQAGTVIEHASAGEILTAPQHPHTRRLFDGSTSGPAPTGR